jgi:hypothetical protein
LKWVGSIGELTGDIFLLRVVDMALGMILRRVVGAAFELNAKSNR